MNHERLKLILDRMKRKMWLQVSWRNHINAGFQRPLMFHLSNRFPIKPQANTIAELSPNLEERVQGLGGGGYSHSTETIAVAEAQAE